MESDRYGSRYPSSSPFYHAYIPGHPLPLRGTRLQPGHLRHRAPSLLRLEPFRRAKSPGHHHRHRRREVERTLRTQRDGQGPFPAAVRRRVEVEGHDAREAEYFLGQDGLPSLSTLLSEHLEGELRVVG